MKVFNFKYCPIFNFFESAEDERFLLILDDYFELPEVDEEKLKRLKDLRTELYNQYQQHDNSDNDLFNISKGLVRLQHEQQFIINALFCLTYKYTGVEVDFDWIEKTLKSLDYELKYNDENSFYIELERLKKKALSKSNQIRRKHKEFEKLKKEPEKKYNYLSVILMIERIANIRLDIYKDTITKFILAKETMISILKEREKQQLKSA